MNAYYRLSCFTLVAIVALSPFGSAQCEEAVLTLSDGTSGDEAGVALSLDGDLALLGVPERERAVVFQHGPTGWVEVAVLEAQGPTTPNPGFGSAVGLKGTTALIGAPLESSSGGTGSVYVFELLPEGWRQTAVLWPPDPHAGDFFGSSVALGPDAALIGAPNADEAFVFERDDQGTPGASDDAWALAALLRPPGLGPEAWFGGRVALSGNTAVVSASGDETYPYGAGGALYVFERSGGVWRQTTKLQGVVPPGVEVQHSLGSSLAMGDEVIVAGTYTGHGVFLFERNDGGTTGHRLDDEWPQAALLFAPDADADAFGEAVAASDDVVIVGAPSPKEYGVGSGHGYAYVYERLAEGWTQTARLEGTPGHDHDGFGAGLDADGTGILVGAPWTDGVAPDAGATHAFELQSVQAVGVPRLGLGINPVFFEQLTPPVLGGVWTTRVDPGSLYAFATVVALGLGGAPQPGTLTSFGELLVLPPYLIDVAEGLHYVPLPGVCAFAGAQVSAQAAVVGSQVILTNALDLTLGTY